MIGGRRNGSSGGCRDVVPHRSPQFQYTTNSIFTALTERRLVALLRVFAMLSTVCVWPFREISFSDLRTTSGCM